jgi:hypothetical protein
MSMTRSIQAGMMRISKEMKDGVAQGGNDRADGAASPIDRDRIC